MNCIAELEDDQFEKTEITHTRNIARAVLVNDKREVCLISIKCTDIFGHRDYFETPGGGVEEGETPQQAVVREVSEETGWNASVICPLGYVSDYYNLIHRHNINNYFLLKAESFGVSHMEKYEEDYISKVGWYPIEKAVEMVDSMNQEPLEKLIRARELPVLKLALQKLNENPSDDEKRIRLVSCAGNVDEISIAFENGADAVAVGLKDFSIRTAVSGIVCGQEKQVNDILRRYHGELFCVCDICLHEPDLEKFRAELRKLACFEISKFIITDPGAGEIVKEVFPKAQLVLSSLANCQNASAVEMFRNMGFSIIIPSKECSLKEVKVLARQCPECDFMVQVHGENVISYTGRSILSSFMKNKSEESKWNYKLALEEQSRPGELFPIAEEAGFASVTDSKELCMIDKTAEIADCGVRYVLIEGRMKGPEYVRSVTRAYRDEIDKLN